MVSEMKTNVDDETSKRLDNLAKIRGQNVSELYNRFTEDELKNCPKSFSKHIRNLKDQKFSDMGIEPDTGLAYLRLENGRTFWGVASKPNHKRQYHYVRDIISPIIDEDTFLLALDITHRYLTDHTWFPEDVLPGEGGTIIELGAYLGHKSLRFVDEVVGTRGKVIAVEMMPDNFDILQRNIMDNYLENTVVALPYGVWNKREKIVVKGKGRQRNSLVDIEKLDISTDVEVETRTLDDIINESQLDVVDFVMITVNGAEIEVLESLDRNITKVRNIFVACPYKRNNNNSSDICSNLLKKKGFNIIDSYSNENRLYAKNPHH